MTYPYHLDPLRPLKRPALYHAVTWGVDQVTVNWYDVTGVQGSRSLALTVDGEIGDICLPASATILDLKEQTLKASMRMFTMLSNRPFGTTDWIAASKEGETANLQTAIGVVSIQDVRVVTQLEYDIDLRKGSGSGTGPTRTLRVTYDEFPMYSDYASSTNPEDVVLPDVQSWCIPGEIEKVYGGYIHDAPGTSLTETQKDNISALILAMDPYV